MNSEPEPDDDADGEHLRAPRLLTTVRARQYCCVAHGVLSTRRAPAQSSHNRDECGSGQEQDTVVAVLGPDAAFLRACRCAPVARTPVWFMRQAGRSLPEYRALRGDGDILEAIAKPELAAELTLQPVRRYGVDAAILFSDIVVPLAAIGIGLQVVPGRGPVIDSPFRSSGRPRPPPAARA